MSDSPKGLNQLNRVLLQTLMSKDAANIVADRLEKLERENARLQMELDASCNAEELRQVRVENAALREDNATLREMLDLAFRVPKMSDTELAEFIRNFRGHIDAARKEQP